MDSYPFIAAAAAVIVVPEQDRVLLVGRRKGNPPPERGFRPAGGRQTTVNRPLAHVRSLRDNTRLSRIFGPPKSPRNPAAGDSPMTTAASDPQIALREPASLPALRIADQGVASALESLLSGQHPPRLRRPVAFVQRLVRRGGVAVDAGGPR